MSWHMNKRLVDSLLDLDSHIRRPPRHRFESELSHSCEFYERLILIDDEEREVVPVFVGGATIVAVKRRKTGIVPVGMFAKDLAVDFELLRLCARNLCMPLYARR